MSSKSLFNDLRAVVQCLFAANYSEREIIQYLMGPFGLSQEAATTAVRDGGGPLSYRCEPGTGGRTGDFKRRARA